MWCKSKYSGQRFQSGDIILPQGCLRRSLGIVQQGEVEIFHKSPDGAETIHSVLRAGQVFGERSLFSDPQPRNTGLRARREAYILLLETRELIRRFHDDPDFAYQALQDLCRRVALLGEGLKSSGAAKHDVS